MGRAKLTLLLASSALSVALSSCVHYAGQPIVPAQSETAFQNRNLGDPGLEVFARSAAPGRAKTWPPAVIDLETATLIAAYFNPAISVARARVRMADAAIVTAGGHPNPSLYSAGGYETFSSSPVVLRLELSLPIETAHKRDYRILEATKLADVARLALKETSWQAYGSVRDAWMDYVAAVEQSEILRRQSDIRASLVSFFQQRLAVGEISRPEWDEARVEASRDAVDLRASEGLVNETRIRLASAVGLPESALAGLRFKTSGYDSPEPIDVLPLDRIQKSGLLNRIDIQRSLLEYAAADAHLHLEIAMQYPDIQLNPGYDFDEGIHKFTLGPSFPIPVWNRNRGPIAEAEARRSETEAQFNALQQKAIGEMGQALAQYKTALAEFREADTHWTVFQGSRERGMIRAVQAGQEDRVALALTNLQTADAAQARLQALTKTHAAFSALENAMQAPLDDVRWTQPQAQGRGSK